MVWDSLCGPDLLDTSGPYSMDFTVHRSTREYVTPSRDLHVPGPTTLTGNDLPIKKLPRAFHPLPNRKARIQGEELYLELNSQLGGQRQMSSPTTPCPKFTSVSRSQSFSMYQRLDCDASSDLSNPLPVCKGLRNRLHFLLTLADQLREGWGYLRICRVLKVKRLLC